MTDVAVPVHCNPSDVEDGANDTQPHKEATDLYRGKETSVTVLVNVCDVPNALLVISRI